jgi:Arabinose efflux permease
MMIIGHTSRDPFASNIPKYFLYTALKNLGFGLFVAIWVIYLQQRRGLSLTQATIVDLTFLIVATFGEVPTGIVADTYGRKVSMVIGSVLMGVSMLAWPIAPTIPLVVIAYAGMAFGFTFLSGAEEALFFESLKRLGRSEDYQRLAGQIGATTLGAFALGNAASGLLATVDLIVPFLAGGLCIIAMLVIVLTLREPPNELQPDSQARKSYRQVLRDALAVMKKRPALRYPMFYLAFVPLAATLMETFLVQPQAILFGVPIAGIGFVVMAVQLTNILGSNWSQQISTRLGEKRVIYLSPLVIVASLVLLAALQVLPSLTLIAVIGFVTAVLRPLVMNLIHAEVSDNIRATALSLLSLLSLLIMAVGELTVGYIGDKKGLPSAYIVLAAGMGVMSLVLLWNSRSHFPQVVESN